MLVGLCSVKGSPGTTTTALALGARWSHGDPVILEADPAGGDLAARYRLHSTPGLVSLAAAARNEASPGLLADHSQRLAGGLRVVPGPVSAEQARAALGVLTTRGARTVRLAASAPNAVVLIDVGRFDPASLALPLVQGADALIVLARPRADELSHVAAVVEQIPTWSELVGLVLVGDGHSRSEIEQQLRIPVTGTLPHDPHGAGFLCGDGRGRPPARSALGHGAAKLCQTLLQHFASYPTPEPTDLDTVLPAKEVIR